jgi:hypothetical protein
MLWWGVLADVPVGLEDVDCPVILAQGTLDALAVGQTPRYLSAVPGARFVPLLGAGHAPQSDAPDAILRLVREATAAAPAADQPATDRPAAGQPAAGQPATDEPAPQGDAVVVPLTSIRHRDERATS